MRWILAGAAWTIAVAVVGLHLLEPPSRRINIRWSGSASQEDIARLEQELALGGGELQEGRTWQYTLRDASRENIARIVAQPSIDDTHYLDREQLALVQELSAVPPWMRSLRQALAVRFGSTSLLWAGLTFGLIGLSAASSFRRNPMFLLLGISLLLRLTLVFSGGQFYWPDEGRFEDARRTAQALAAGRLSDAVDQVAAAGPLFRLIALVPAGLELPIGESPIIPGVSLPSSR